MVFMKQSIYLGNFNFFYCYTIYFCQQLLNHESELFYINFTTIHDGIKIVIAHCIYRCYIVKNFLNIIFHRQGGHFLENFSEHSSGCTSRKITSPKKCAWVKEGSGGFQNTISFRVARIYHTNTGGLMKKVSQLIRLHLFFIGLAS